MKIAVLSGKGGTGKTLVSVNLAAVAAPSVYVDCDVEEPNGYLYFRPTNVKSTAVTHEIPILDETRCIGCRKCVDFCKFNALAFVKNKPYVFEDVCHACGGCIVLCPEGAMHPKERNLGSIERGLSNGVTVYTGLLNPGEASGVPIIQKLLKETCTASDRIVLIDCPPGSACSVMESIQDVDFCLLVAEPTLFGTHNLNMVWDLVQLFDKPYGVVLNKCLQDEKNPAEEFCSENNLPILGRIPFDTVLGELNGNGKIAAWESPAYHTLFDCLLHTIVQEDKP